MREPIHVENVHVHKPFHDGRLITYRNGIWRSDGTFQRRREVVAVLVERLDDFDPSGEYTVLQLDLWADAFLRQQINDGKPNTEEPVILLEEHETDRRKREIYAASGKVSDEMLTELQSPDGQMMYWRTHPGGRKRNDSFRVEGSKASFYR